MSEIIRGVICMPYALAMSSEISRRQFHTCAQALIADRDQLEAEVQRLTKAVGLQVIRRFVGDDDQKYIDELVASGIQVDKELIAQLRAENEALRKIPLIVANEYSQLLTAQSLSKAKAEKFQQRMNAAMEVDRRMDEVKP